MEKKFDTIILGGGPNGLLAGAYLARAGQKVLVLEKRYEMGGGLATEEVTTAGYYHNTHAIYMMMVDYAPAYTDLELEKKYSLHHIFPSLQIAMPLKNGKWVGIYNDVEKTCQSFAKFSQKDADAYRNLYAKFKVWTDDFLAPYTYVQPRGTLEIAAQMEALEMGQEMFELTEKTPRDLVEEWFSDPYIRGLMINAICFWGLEPEQSGLGYLIPLYFNRTSSYRICKTGSHALTQSLIKNILENKGVVLTSQDVKRIMVINGEARGVEMEDGTTYESQAVLSTIDLHQTFLNLVGEDHLPSEFVEGIKLWMWEHWAFFGVHLALEEAPQYKDSELNQALITILGCETIDDYLEHYKAIEEKRIPDKPIAHCTIPTIHDPTQCRHPGKHTGILQTHVPYDLADGGAEKWWNYAFYTKEAEKLIELLRSYAPNMTEDAIRSVYVSTPIGYANKFKDMVKGSYKQGAYHPFQMGYIRPNEECSNHRSPIKGLYLGGACTYPGGTILMANGYLAADAICEDLGITKWWPEPEMIKKAREKGIPPF
ncbi:MAG: NAD(P)/FAD-dependent oxidoreductase [Pseudomonadota bacterium]